MNITPGSTNADGLPTFGVTVGGFDAVGMFTVPSKFDDVLNLVAYRVAELSGNEIDLHCLVIAEAARLSKGTAFEQEAVLASGISPLEMRNVASEAEETGRPSPLAEYFLDSILDDITKHFGAKCTENIRAMVFAKIHSGSIEGMTRLRLENAIRNKKAAMQRGEANTKDWEALVLALFIRWGKIQSGRLWFD